MRFIRREMDFADFMDHIGWGFWLSLVISIVFFLLFLLVLHTMKVDRMREQRLYAALQWYVVADPVAEKAADLARMMYQGPRPDPNILASEFLKSRSPNSIRFAMEHWDRVEAVMANPEKVVVIVPPDWRYWWKIVILSTTSFITLSCSLSYVLTTMGRHEYRREEIWEYPWNRWWAYAAVPFVSPYIIASQPVAGLLTILLRGRPPREEPRVLYENSEKAVSHRKRKKIAKERIRAIQVQREENLRRWVLLRFGAFFLEGKRKDTERRVQEQRSALEALGAKVATSQRALGESTQELRGIEESIASLNPSGMAGTEFDRLLALPHVMAGEVRENGEFSVFTDTVYVGAPPHEIGIFEIVFVVGGGFRVKNLCSRYVKSGHPHQDSGGSFCFGNVTNRIGEHIGKQEYVEAVSLIVSALHIYSLKGQPRYTLSHWPVVLRKEEGV